MDRKIPLLVITGPTASGKTRLSIDLARCYHGEIVCADSMQIYKEMQIATAKPTAEEMQDIPPTIFLIFYPWMRSIALLSIVQRQKKQSRIFQAGRNSLC